MTSPIVRFNLILFLATLSFFYLPADDSKPADKGKDVAVEPLPKGAKVRFGSSRMVFRYTPAVAFVPPDFKTFLVPDTSSGLRRFEASTGLPLDAGGVESTQGGQVVVSADGKRAAVGIRSLSVREVGTGAEIIKLTPPAEFSPSFTYGNPSVSISSDGKRLAQGGEGKDRKGEVIVWDVDKNQVLARLPMVYTGTALPILAADGKTVGVRAYQFNAAPAPTAPPGNGADPRQTIQVWDVASSKELFKARPQGGDYQGGMTAVFSPDGKALAASTGVGPIDLWEVETGKPLRTLLGRTGQGVRLAFSPDSKIIAGVATDGTIQRWSVAEGKLLGTTETPPNLPNVKAFGLSFEGADRVVAWGAVGAGIGLVAWEAPSGKLLTPVGEHTSGIKSIGFGKGGSEIVTAGLDGRIVRWDAVTGKPTGVMNVRWPHGFLSSAPGLVVNLSPDATRAVSAGTVRPSVFDLATGTELFAVPQGPSGSAAAYYTPSADLTKLFVFWIPIDPKRAGSCTVWDLVNQRRVATIEVAGSPGVMPAAAVSPDGTRLVTAASGRTPEGMLRGRIITGWDLKTGKKLGEVEVREAGGNVFVAAANNTSAVVSYGMGKLVAVDSEGGRLGEEIDKPRVRGEGTTGPVVFSPDGTHFANGIPTDEYGVYGVRIYDWPSGKPMHTFTGHTGAITALAFSPDGKFLASGSADTTVLLWDLSTLGK